MLGKFEAEIHCCDRALELRPRYLSAWVNRGYAYGKLRWYEEEIICYDRALKIYPFFFQPL